jgi:hypothetical protein
MSFAFPPGRRNASPRSGIGLRRSPLYGKPPGRARAFDLDLPHISERRALGARRLREAAAAFHLRSGAKTLVAGSRDVAAPKSGEGPGCARGIASAAPFGYNRAHSASDRDA